MSSPINYNPMLSQSYSSYSTDYSSDSESTSFHITIDLDDIEDPIQVTNDSPVQENKNSVGKDKMSLVAALVNKINNKENLKRINNNDVYINECFDAENLQQDLDDFIQDL